jgi:hypothetical protein
MYKMHYTINFELSLAPAKTVCRLLLPLILKLFGYHVRTDATPPTRKKELRQ